MFRKLRPRSVYDVFALIALVVAVGGTSAYAANEWTGANIVDGSLTGQDVFDNTISGNDITNNSVASADVKDGSLGTVDIGELHGSRIVNGSIGGNQLGTGAVTGIKVANNTLDDFNIQESTLFKCHNGTTLFGRICASTNGSGAIGNALGTCGNLGLRVPTVAEAYLLARNYDIPGVAESEYFWTSDVADTDSVFGLDMIIVSESLNIRQNEGAEQAKIVCVETATGLS